MEKIPKFNKRRVFNKGVGPGKNPKLINVGPTFILDYTGGFLYKSYLHSRNKVVPRLTQSLCSQKT